MLEQRGNGELLLDAETERCARTVYRTKEQAEPTSARFDLKSDSDSPSMATQNVWETGGSPSSQNTPSCLPQNAHGLPSVSEAHEESHEEPIGEVRRLRPSTAAMEIRE